MDDGLLGVGCVAAIFMLLGVWAASTFCEILLESGWECTEYAEVSYKDLGKHRVQDTCVEYRRVGTTKKAGVE